MKLLITQFSPASCYCSLSGLDILLATVCAIILQSYTCSVCVTHLSEGCPVSPPCGGGAWRCCGCVARVLGSARGWRPPAP
jgi:hypothetical protein